MTDVKCVCNHVDHECECAECGLNISVEAVGIEQRYQIMIDEVSPIAALSPANPQ